MRAKHLQKGDKIAIVSLSSGILGESFIQHELELGVKRLKEFGLEPVFMPNARKGLTYVKEHPEARAADLKQAFLDYSIKGILCAIGGDDTYRTLPYLLEDEEFKIIVQKNPKIFLGFSDTTINHLMFYKLGLPTLYGQAFLPDFAELDQEMLPYTKNAFLNLFKASMDDIYGSSVWYMERHDFSLSALGTPRKKINETKGFEVLQGNKSAEGILLGGCLDSMYDMLSTNRYPNELEICKKYDLFPSKEEWKGKILLLETSEEQATPTQYEEMLLTLRKTGIFDVIEGIIHGKPMDEKYYQEYKEILLRVVHRPELLIVYNVNIGHATPRGILPLNTKIRMNIQKKCIQVLEDILE